MTHDRNAFDRATIKATELMITGLLCLTVSFVFCHEKIRSIIVSLVNLAEFSVTTDQISMKFHGNL